MQERFFDGKDVYTPISLNAADGVSQQRARRRRAEGAARRRRGADRRRLRRGEQGRASTRSSASCRPSCWSSPAVSLVVGIFLIINTFSILVAQRSRELALLRAMGASRRQVNRSVLAEALAVGLRRLDGRARGRLPARARAALAVRRVRPRPEPRRRSRSPGRPSIWSYVVGLVRHRDRGVSCPRGGPPGSPRSPRCATTSRCRRRRCGAGCSSAGAGGASGAALIGARPAIGDGNTALLAIGGGILLVLSASSLMSPVIGRPVLHPVRRDLPPRCSARSARWPPRTPCATRAVRRRRPAP